MAKERRIHLPLFPVDSHLEPMARTGVFVPIAFMYGAFHAETSVLHPNPSDLAWLEEEHPLPWRAFAWINDVITHPTISERYSPWQILYLDEALQLFERFQNEPDRAQLSKRLQVLDEQWRPFIKLLIALQPRLWSYRRGRTSLVWDGDTQIDVAEWARRSFAGETLLRRFELTLDRVAELHLALLEAGLQIDPTPKWHELTESAPRDVSDQFRGEALRARDRYDAAYLMRGLYYLMTDDWLPRADQLHLDNSLNYYRRRHLPVRPQNSESRRLNLKNELIHQGIYPHRIHFFVEGPTEKIVIERVLGLIGYRVEGSGMAVTSIDSVDALKRHEVIVRIATEVASSVVLIADREGTLLKMLGRLRNEGLFVDDDDILIWGADGTPNDFEAANFTEPQILDAVNRAAAKKAPDFELNLSSIDLEEARLQKPSPAKASPHRLESWPSKWLRTS